MSKTQCTSSQVALAFKVSRLSALWSSILLLGIVSLMPAHARAAVIADCDEAALRTALEAGGEVIVECTGTIVISNTIVVAKNTLLTTTNQSLLLQGNGARLFHVLAGAEFRVEGIDMGGVNLTGANGTDGADGESVFGGAIWNDGGRVHLIRCSLRANILTGGNGANGSSAGGLAGSDGGDGGNGGKALGGAIFNSGHLELDECDVSENQVKGGQGGNGADGFSTGNGSTGGDGGDGGRSSGGAIFNTGGGVIILRDTSFSSNNVSGATGGLGGAGAGFVAFHGENGSPSGGLGGAIFNEDGIVRVNRSTFSENSTVGAAGGGARDALWDRSGTDGTSGSLGAGGALCNFGILAVTNSTFFANIVVGGGGGNGGDGGTFGFGGDGGDGGRGGAGLGGAIYNADVAEALLVNTTAASNGARGGSGGTNGLGGGAVGRDGRSGGLGRSLGGAAYNDGGLMVIKNSMFASSVSGGNLGGVIADGGFNLSSDDSIPFTSTSKSGINLELRALRDNGGPTLTMAISSNSPAINAITHSGGNGCPAEDQRSFARVGLCDIGAFEFGAGPVLSISSDTDGLQLAWPAVAGDFKLESTTDLGATNLWRVVTNQVSVSQDQRTVIVSPGTSRTFFRLGKSP